MRLKQPLNEQPPTWRRRVPEFDIPAIVERIKARRELADASISTLASELGIRADRLCALRERPRRRRRSARAAARAGVGVGVRCERRRRIPETFNRKRGESRGSKWVAR
jgi:hypothetical protein